MAEYDLVIRGGIVVDGTGIPRYKSDLAVKDGRVARISGKIAAGSAKELDARGCIVAPGAIDLHTHYDAQLNWDSYCSLSGWFGVTSLTIGQCGFGFAPTRPDDRDLNMRMMNRIEAIPLESMRKGIRWDWVTFPEFMDSLERQGLGLNVAPLFPFSPMRGYALGMIEARQRTSVTEAELNQMKQLFHEAMKAGAFGFSGNKDLNDRPEDGGYLPSHVASDEEFLALAEVLGEFGVGCMGWTMGGMQDTSEAQWMLSEMMRRSGRPLTVGANSGEEGMEWLQACRAEGLPLVNQEISMNFLTRSGDGAEFTLAEYNLFDYMPHWVEPLVGSAQERAAKLRDPNRRALMKQDVIDNPNNRNNYGTLQVVQVMQERNYDYEGMTVEELGQATGKHPLDAMLDLALDEDLDTYFSHPFGTSEDDVRQKLITNPHAHVSVSDGGAHTRYLTFSTWPVHWLAHWCRDKEAVTLEQAHYKISTLPAWIASIKGRGTLRVGNWADIIVYDQEKLGYLYEKPIYANDFPGGERRLVQKSTGIQYTIVNGTVTFEGNDCTGALPGKLLRSYDSVD